MRTSARRCFVLILALAALGCSRSGGSRDGGGISQDTAPGDLALDYVTKANFDALKVEIDFLQGAGPSTEAISRAREIWERRLDKPAGVDIVIDDEIPSTERSDRWEIGDVLALESEFRDNFTGDENNRDTAVIWIVYLNGRSEFDEDLTRALGVAFEGSSIAVFRDNISAASPAVVRDIVEAMVLIHEGGHLFGLVNNGVPMVNDHEDPRSPRHDASSGCVMFHQIETSNVELLLDSPPLDYDFQCRLDMYTAGGVQPEAPAGGEPGDLTVTTPARPRGGRGHAPHDPGVPGDRRSLGSGNIIPDLATILPATTK